MSYYSKNKKKILKQCKLYRDNNKEILKQRILQFKKEVFSHYGGVCQCCGESHIQFLTIDHINGRGNEHRRNNKIWSGTSTYRWLKRNKYPPGFQVLCFNCNMAKRTSDFCPHLGLSLQIHIKGEE